MELIAFVLFSLPETTLMEMDTDSEPDSAEVGSASIGEIPVECI